jgi:CheY-like chemotaxis protein
MTKVLIVEDEPLVARMYEKALTFDKFDVVTAIGGNNGIKACKEEKPDIVLMDIMMPEMNGIEALGLIKEDPEISDIPVVMLTNLSGVHDIELAKEKGAVDYWVKKDIKPREMGEKIEAILEGSSTN